MDGIIQYVLCNIWLLCSKLSLWYSSILLHVVVAVFFHCNLVLSVHHGVILQFVHFTLKEHLGYFNFEMLYIMPPWSINICFLGTHASRSRIAGSLERMYLDSVDISRQFPNMFNIIPFVYMYTCIFAHMLI